MHYVPILKSVLIKNFDSTKYDNKFYKIHGCVHTLCLTRQQLEELHRNFRKTIHEEEKNKIKDFKGNI